MAGAPTSSLAALTLGAIGVVYGDIGTSPLYALKEVFANGHVPLTPHNIYGVLSLVFWTLTVDRLDQVRRPDPARRQQRRGRPDRDARARLAGGARPAGAAPAPPASSASSAPRSSSATASSRRRSRCSSAVEGLEVAAPGLHTWVVPVTLVVLTALFLFQRHGTARVGKLFGPVMVVWFLVIAVLGLVHIGDNPSILKALSPHYALVFMLGHPRVAFIALGSVVLCVTGAEALYADMGHFGKRPIRLAWFGIAMPALVLNYFGQGAMLLADPAKVGNPVLRDGADLGALSADRAGDLRHGDRLAGADHGGVLGHQAGDAARLPAAPAHRPHLGARDRPDLRAVRQLEPVRLHRHRGRAVRLERQARPRPTASR